MNWIFIAILIFVGLIFLLLEVLVIPGTTVAALVGFGLVTAGIWQAYAAYGTFTGTMVLIATIAVTAIMLFVSLRSKTWRKMALNTAIDSKVNTLDHLNLLVGDKGIAISRIAPGGTAKFGESIVEVASYGDFIDNGSPIEIISLEENKIYIKRTTL
jgi:membrane-bound ClpP family serine protease